MHLFQELNSEGVTLVIVTHEPEISSHTQRIVELRDGRVVRDVPVANPRDARADQRAPRTLSSVGTS